jgi:adenosylhomocysteine nucleosidase
MTRRPALGFATASGAEARFVLGCRRWTQTDGRMICRSQTPDGVGLLAVRSGVGMKSALAAANWLVEEGVTALACIGVGAGLHPGLRPGEVVIGEKVIEQGTGGSAWDAYGPGIALAHGVLLAQGMRTWRGAVLSTKSAVLSAQDKSTLYRKTRALVADMESAAVARTAAEFNLPFLALRAVCDPQERTLDQDLTDCLDPAGRIRCSVLLRNLFRRPSLITSLPPMARDFVLALSALRRAWQTQLTNTMPLVLAGWQSYRPLDRDFSAICDLRRMSKIRNPKLEIRNNTQCSKLK